jgi:hypothetical protein
MKKRKEKRKKVVKLYKCHQFGPILMTSESKAVIKNKIKLDMHIYKSKTSKLSFTLE